MTQEQFNNLTVDDISKIVAENETLKSQLSDLKQEHLTVVRTVIKVLDAIGLWPLNANDNIMSKAIKAVKSVALDAVINPSNLEKRFSFVGDLYPLAEKYKDIQL
ncbi:MAG: hypothetical protein PHX80_05565 [Candidatus Nanoarchaeia archaeon]|nr:hypothetical protein [Candidatus Nanoarchaeia archaeon]